MTPYREHHRQNDQGGFALIVVLIFSTVVAFGIVAFLSNALANRREAQALGNAARAAQAAQAAADIGTAKLQALLARYPDSATAWSPGSSSASSPATLLYYRAHPGGAGTLSATTPLWKVPLHSGAQANTSGNAIILAHPNLPFEHEDNSIDLNQPRYPGDTGGWIGSPSGGRMTVRVPWVELPEAGAGEPRVTRYAWWIDDESFRLNLNEIGIGVRSEGPGVSPSEVPFQGALAAVIESPTMRDMLTRYFALFRRNYPGGRIPELRALNHLSDGFPQLGEQLRYYTTTHSSALNLSRTGSHRVNLNALVAPSVDPAAVRHQLDTLLAPIRRDLPAFGQRFYRLNQSESSSDQVPESHAAIYLEKIAANLRDALSPDPQPTIVLADGSVRIGSEPTTALTPKLAAPGVPNNPTLAIGKKRLPYLQEYACRVTLRQFQVGSGQFAYYELDIDHYFEFWNMSTRDLSVGAGDLGKDPFLLITDLPGFDAGTFGNAIPAGRTLRIPLPNSLVFPAGRVTVITTDPFPNTLLVRDPNRVVILATGADQRSFAGRTYLKTEDGKFRLNLQPRSTTATDYETKVILGNAHGYLESHCALPLARGDSAGNLALSIHNDERGNRVLDRVGGNLREAYYVRGGSLRGNLTTPSLTGDPRTNNEQLLMRPYDGDGDDEQTRFYNSELGNPSSNGKVNVPALSSIGWHNWNFVSPLLWPDSFLPSEDGVDAPMVLPGGAFQSIGELGHLFDPARELGPTRQILYSRGGGRTLSIGQPDLIAAARPEIAAWRLTDLFSTTDALTLPGLVNLNGLLRDGGIAFRALLYGFIFSRAEGDPLLAGKTLEPEVLDELVEAVAQRLANDEPLMERGELSECLSMELSADSPRAHLHDRGREEIFRRLVELITTRGSVFTVYAVGQTCAVNAEDQRTVLSSSRMRITFELIPEWTPELPERLDPANPAQRLRPPDRFVTRVLSVSSQ